MKSGDGVPPNDSAGQRQQRETLAESAKQVGKAGLRSSSSDNAVVLSSPKRLKEAAGIDFLGFTDGKAAFDAFYSYMPYNMRVSPRMRRCLGGGGCAQPCPTVIDDEGGGVGLISMVACLTGPDQGGGHAAGHGGVGPEAAAVLEAGGSGGPQHAQVRTYCLPTSQSGGRASAAWPYRVPRAPSLHERCAESGKGPRAVRVCVWCCSPSTCKEVDVLLLSKGRCYVALQTDLLFTSYHVQRYKHEPSGDTP